jgi:hypothetical protein
MNAAFSLVHLVVALAITGAFGIGILRLVLGTGLARTPIAERLGLVWLLGSGAVSLLLFLLGFVLRGWLLVLLVTLAALGMLALSWRNRVAGRAVVPKFSVAEWLLVVGFAGQAGFLLWLTPQVALGWDALVLWEAKARGAFLHGGTLPVTYFSEPPATWGHPRYPLYLPYMETWLYLWLGRADQAWVRVIGPITYAATVLLLIGGAQRMGVPRVWAMAAGFAFFFVPYCFTGQWSALVGYADLPLGMIYLAAASRLPEIWRGALRRELVLFACLAALVGWVKQEGFFLWLLLAGCAALPILWRRKWMDLGVLLLPGVIIGVGFKAFLLFVGAPADPFYHLPTPENLMRFADRIVPVFAAIGRELVNFESWSLLWVGVVLAFIVLFLKRAYHLALFIVAAVVAPLFLYAWPFVLSALPSYETHLEHALARLMFQVAPTAMLAVALALPARLRPAGVGESGQ